jgi:predicted nucleic acid-binding Zn ribbon protein
VPFQRLPSEHGPDPQAVGDALERVLRGLGMPGAKGITTVFDDWPSVVGNTAAARTRPVAIDGGTLVVATDEPGVASQLRYLEPQLLARLAEVCGDDRIRAIAVRVEGTRRRGKR